MKNLALQGPCSGVYRGSPQFMFAFMYACYKITKQQTIFIARSIL